MEKRGQCLLSPQWTTRLAGGSHEIVPRGSMREAQLFRGWSQRLHCCGDECISTQNATKQLAFSFGG